MNKTFQYRIYPTKDQENTLVQWQGQTRFLWNKFLLQNIEEYNTNQKFIWKFTLNKQLPALKAANHWLNAPAHSLQQVAINLDKALKTFLKNRKSIGTGFPKLKKKGKDTTGLYIPQVGTHIKLEDKFIKIPKLGLIKIRKH